MGMKRRKSQHPIHKETDDSHLECSMAYVQKKITYALVVILHVARSFFHSHFLSDVRKSLFSTLHKMLPWMWYLVFCSVLDGELKKDVLELSFVIVVIAILNVQIGLSVASFCFGTTNSLVNTAFFCFSNTKIE